MNMVPNPQLFCSLAGIKGEQETHVHAVQYMKFDNFWKAQSHGIAKGLQSIKTVMMGVMWVTMATDHHQRERNAREYNSKCCLGMRWIENTALLLCPSKFSSHCM